MICIELNTQIYRPLKQVFHFVATPENDFQWQYGTLSSARISTCEMGVGALFRAAGHFIGHRIESVYEVTDFEPDKRYGFKSLSENMHSRTLYTFDIQEGSTAVKASIQIVPGSFFQSSVTNAEKRVKKQYRENLALLKNVLETSQVESRPR
jgi:hypothetical protein